MRHLHLRLLVTGTAVALASLSPVWGQACAPPTPAVRTDTAMSVQQALTGNSFPTTLTFGEMREDWQQFSLESASNATEFFLEIALMSEGVAPDQQHGIYYTQGRTITVGEATYLIAYQCKQQFDVSLFQHRQSNSSLRERTERRLAALAHEKTQLRLCLINLEAAGSVMDISPFKADEVIARDAETRTQILEEAKIERLGMAESALRALYHGVTMYADGHKGLLPSMSSIQATRIAIGQSSDSRWTELASGPKDDPLWAPITFRTNATLSGKRLGAMKQYPWLVVAYQDALSSDGTRAVLFMDGTVKRVAEPEWHKIKQTSKISE